jgi:hypothetical protein
MNRAAYRLGRVVSIPRAEWCVACRRHSSAAPPSLHAGVAITVPRSGALLTGLATAVASVPAVILCPRRYHCPLAGCFFLIISCANRSLFSQGLRGAAPRARQGKAPADAGADPSGLPGLPRFSHSADLRRHGTRLCRPALRAALFGRAIPLRSGRLGTCYPPVSPTGRGAGAECLHPRSQQEINHVGQAR